MAVKRSSASSVSSRLIHEEERWGLTRDRCVLAHISVLVPLQKALRLDRRCLASGKLLVEAHHSLHAGGIGG
jgi:hypothetical protein